ncbi:DUF5134 domain-containing protein [Kitasatospora sp. NE20-6]|uniref:DUF5134 domain-containing protein n=1 Tax=Kitasatospora sp. NE20-6 TaxID=2859066 RepID=UPI0038B234DF
MVTWLLAGLAAGAAGLCLLRLRSPGCRGAHRRGEAAEAAMAAGTAGMAVLPGVVWGWVFTVLAGWLLLGAVGERSGLAHRLHHGVGSLAMAYMALAMAPGHGHLHPGVPMGLPAVTGGLLLYFGGYTLWAGSRLLAAPDATAHAAQTTHTTHAAHTTATAHAAMWGRAGDGTLQACRAAMGIAMFAMLLTL